MESNLRVYPEYNYMSLFGLGALNLYAKKLSLSAKYLEGARNVAIHFSEKYGFLVEDSFVLTSEMIWNHHVDAKGVQSEKWRELSIQALDFISNSTRFRSLVMGNMGLLKYIAARSEDELREAEYLVIAATEESMVQKSLALESQMLAMVYNNAACLRMISPARRWGLGRAVEHLLRGGIMQAKMADNENSRDVLSVLLHNLAIMMAVSGRINEGVSTMNEAISLVVDKNEEKYVSWSSQLVAMQDPSYVQFLEQEGEVLDWIGEVADRRIGKFGGNCEVQLIWY